MNGQLSEHPLAELIREISAKSFGGRLQLHQDRARVAVYFDKGQLLYAASNLRTLRLREYLLKAGIAEAAVARYDQQQRSDVELAKTLCRDHLLSPAAAEQIQSKQVADVLRLVLLWTEGAWDLDERSRLNEAPKVSVEVRSLLLDAGRRMSPKFAASRFGDRAEVISPVANPFGHDNLLPTEVFLLSRLDRPMALTELLAISGLSENDTLVVIYSLALGGLLQRERWKMAFGQRPSEAAAPEPEPPAPVSAPAEEQPAEAPEEIESFLERVNSAPSHYDVLGVSKEASPVDMKTKYYELARRYHPDRFRRTEASLLSRVESAFARITQAYDTLRDDHLRSTYDSKLQARQKAQQLADTAPKPTAPVVTPAEPPERAPAAGPSLAERAELQFKEGFAALELGQRKTAIGLLGAAARAVPSEPRYRAFYGQVLAAQESTRRAAETELQAAVKLDPQNGEYRMMLAELYRDLGLPLRAKGEAERAVAADPNNRKARDLLRALK